MLISIKEINENKRYVALFAGEKTTKFGQTNPKKGTYIDHKDKKLRTNYIKRHLKDLKTNDNYRPGFLSLFISWNKETLKDSIKDFNRRIKIMIRVLNKKLNQYFFIIEYYIMNNFYKISGNGLKINEIKNFIQSSYIEEVPKILLGYVLDEELSNLYGKVYVNKYFKNFFYLLGALVWKI
jgi:hypothetical protein